MKNVGLLACLLLLSVLTVNADGFFGGGGWFGGGPGGPGGGGPGGPGGGGPGGPGGDGPGGDSEEEGKGGSCSCTNGRWWNPWRNACSGVTGLQVKGCSGTNQYLQCNGTACANQTCPSGQVWNQTQSACAACPDGKQVSTNQQVCVCKTGTTMDYKTRSCAPCPSDSIQEPDRCYCNASKGRDYVKNACRDCPAGSTVTFFQQCQCMNQTFFNKNDWACQPCPGQWLPKYAPSRRFFRPPPQVCTCNATNNEIFDRVNVKCYTCPSGSTADGNECECSIRSQEFNMATGTCECREGSVLDSTSKRCVRATATTTSTTTPGP